MLSWVLLIFSDGNITSSHSCCIHIEVSAQERLIGMKGKRGLQNENFLSTMRNSVR